MTDRGGTGERITYLIANYNLGAYVGECLSSLHEQTNPDWLALIVDDASTDDSLASIGRFSDDRVRLLVNERNIGYIATLRRLIAEASTDIVAILDADDTLSVSATEELLSAYASDSRPEFVYSRFAVCDEALAVRGVHGSEVPPGSTVLREGVVGHIRSFRRTAYQRTAGLDERMLYAEDRDLVYKLEEVTRPVFIDAVLYHYREVSGSQSRDPEKREIGARNTWRARRAALRRRHVSGFRNLTYETYFWADYVAYSDRSSAAARRIARWLSKLSGRACRGFDPRVRAQASANPRD